MDRFRIALLAVCLPGFAADYTVTKDETLDRRFTFAGGATREFVLKNVNGSIRVTPATGNDLVMSVKIRWRAESQARLDEARRDVQLKIEENSSGVRVCLETGCNCGENRWGRDMRGYDFHHEFELQAPKDVRLRLNTVSGDIHLDHTTSAFELNTVNGAVDMTEVSGSGRAYALNGGVKATFTSNPSEKSYFGSLNGKVEIAFMPGFAAKAMLKSFNGSFYSDFPVTPVASAPEPGRREEGRWVYRSRGYRAVQIGSGGPEIQFETFNGDVHILSREKR